MKQPEIQRLLERQAVEVQSFTLAEARSALRLYRETRSELLQRLEFLEGSGKGSRFTAVQYRGALAQVQEGLRGLETRLGQRLRGTVSQTAELAGEHLFAQLRTQVARHPGAVAPLPLRAALAIRDGSALLLPQFDSSVRRYGADLLAGIQRRLAVSLASQESMAAARARIFRDFLQPLGTVQLGDRDVPVTAYWAERIVRTETASAYGVSFQVQLSAAAKEDRSLRKQWSAALERTCPTCRSMDGRVVEVDAPFRLPGGGVVMTPPAHPNCMCTAVAWAKSWN
jgi:hypothetical protein